MSSDNTGPNWTARVALLAIVPAVVGGLWLFNKESHDTEPAVVVATSCSEFKTNAKKLFDKGGTAVLSGTFAPGDHVHLTIDFKGLGYSWELTGVLATTHVDMTGLRPYSSTKKYTRVTYNKDKAIESIVSRGKISGSADVTAAGAGAITINKTGGAPSFASPKVKSASCIASRKKSIEPTA
jgi:hypothetical protein